MTGFPGEFAVGEEDVQMEEREEQDQVCIQAAVPCDSGTKHSAFSLLGPVWILRKIAR